MKKHKAPMDGGKHHHPGHHQEKPPAMDPHQHSDHTKHNKAMGLPGDMYGHQGDDYEGGEEEGCSSS